MKAWHEQTKGGKAQVNTIYFNVKCLLHIMHLEHLTLWPFCARILVRE
uniref:Uncharacterized protein n=1 Tax=Arundo donax TaxID=35708 RepID=A0A0A9D4A1_ARUDO